MQWASQQVQRSRLDARPSAACRPGAAEPFAASQEAGRAHNDEQQTGRESGVCAPGGPPQAERSRVRHCRSVGSRPGVGPPSAEQFGSAAAILFGEMIEPA